MMEALVLLFFLFLDFNEVLGRDTAKRAFLGGIFALFNIAANNALVFFHLIFSFPPHRQHTGHGTPDYAE